MTSTCEPPRQPKKISRGSCACHEQDDVSLSMHGGISGARVGCASVARGTQELQCIRRNCSLPFLSPTVMQPKASRILSPFFLSQAQPRGHIRLHAKFVLELRLALEPGPCPREIAMGNCCRVTGMRDECRGIGRCCDCDPGCRHRYGCRRCSCRSTNKPWFDARFASCFPRTTNSVSAFVRRSKLVQTIVELYLKNTLRIL